MYILMWLIKSCVILNLPTKLVSLLLYCECPNLRDSTIKPKQRLKIHQLKRWQIELYSDFILQTKCYQNAIILAAHIFRVAKMTMNNHKFWHTNQDFISKTVATVQQC